MRSTPFNVNDKVMFQLSKAGREEAKKLVEAEQVRLNLKRPRALYMEDWNEMGFWEFAYFFGPVLKQCTETLFDDLELVTE